MTEISSTQDSKSALFIFAEGFEELELIAPLDILRRAGVACTLASAGPALLLSGRNQIRVQADIPLADVIEKRYDMIVIPGGPGVTTLRKDSRIGPMIREHVRAGRVVAAICAGPMVLLDAGVLEGKRCTAHESVIGQIPGATDAEAVVEDGLVITSRGAGTAVSFGLALAHRLVGSDRTKSIRESIHWMG